MISIRKLAAVDIYLHGTTFVLIEFGFALGFLAATSLVKLLKVGTQKGYGFVDDSTPEISMAIEPAFN